MAAMNEEDPIIMVDESECDDSSHCDEAVAKPTARQLQEAEEKNKLLQRNEEKAVSCVRVAVYCVVVITAISVTLAVYFYTKNEQENNFQTVFEIYANKLAESFIDSVDRKIVAIGGLSTTITNYALSNGLTFPNVTIDNWIMLAGQTRVQADAINVEYAPLVTDDNRLGWEEYAFSHKQWQQDQWEGELKFMESQNQYFGLEEDVIEDAPGSDRSQNEESSEGEPPPENELQPSQEGQGPPPENGQQPPQRSLEEAPPAGDEPGYTRQIFGLGPPPMSGPPASIPKQQASGPYAPFWHMSPILPRDFLLNLDLLSRPSSTDSIVTVLETQRAALGGAVGVRDPSNTTLAELVPIRLTNDYVQRGQYRHELQFFSGDATTTLTYPVFDSFGANRTVAGFLLSPLMWRLNFEKIVPESLGGFIAVIKSKQSEPFSYRIEGPKATYLGIQDSHASNYDDMFVFQNMEETLQVLHSPRNQAFDAVQVDFGEYVLYIYPTEELESQYITNKPAVYALIVASVFLFTILVLAVFDLLVARRQQVVMKKAVKSRALIATLYPEQVRERMFEDGPKGNVERRKWKNPGEAGIQEESTKAIATLYESATILLMDLAGFTEWSSARTPSDVFELLETLYQSFDRIASKRGVYKIETIGDCWVGVTGVPNPQKDHAPRMAKFAAACQVSMGQLVGSKLADRLGADTANLKLRVGMHSGPITGGILRGDKGRFQLFGDSINTASRMESNGVPGKIHVSQSTADELIRHGNRDWLTEREDKVEAKGKGLMTTYWVAVKSSRSTGTRASLMSLSDETGGCFAEYQYDAPATCSMGAESQSERFDVGGRPEQGRTTCLQPGIVELGV
ncbi:Receptor-type guanylate cyclase gcy [Seminavis robusta]|uniref:Receptor-type guanylate cyclase gcy n=1 Tax=Seminavis robusta TaxID=568900 RepID=A0A9N8EQQ5_9STRA|nr:Receptor-type guanylate cyclase gcy [Seminavis robusta]|eukprot:Sro1360_g266050.1 Receptor-type guanylate cyclase gcy (853) ;mRNA; r:3443-6711